MDTAALAAIVDPVVAESQFSGVVRVDRGDTVLLERAAGWAHRAYGVGMTTDTRLAIASGTKAFTALVVLSLVEEGRLGLDTRVRELLGSDLPLVDDAVTVEQLLAHRSGIGDYLDENEDAPIEVYALAVPPHTLAETTDYLTVLDGFAQVSVPGERFAYNNGAFIVLALLAERVTGTPFRQLAQERVFGPAGMVETDYPRSDTLRPRTAAGYLAADGDQTNVLHLPLRGVGDGGAYSTVADIGRLWRALRSGAVVGPDLLARAWAPLSDVPDEDARYGLGFWLFPDGPVVRLEGYDPGISFRSAYDPRTDTAVTVIANWTDGAWPLSRVLEPAVFGS